MKNSVLDMFNLRYLLPTPEEHRLAFRYVSLDFRRKTEDSNLNISIIIIF